MESTDNGKATIISSINEIKISIPSKKSWILLIFQTIWIGGWYFGLQNTLEMSIINDGEIGTRDGIIVFWLIAWITGGLFIIGLLLWGYFGKEILKIENDKVLLKKNIFGIGRNRILQKSAIKNIRFNKVEIKYFSGKNRWAVWGIGEGKIKFDYGMKTYSLGLGVDDAEANHLIRIMKQRLQ